MLFINPTLILIFDRSTNRQVRFGHTFKTEFRKPFARLPSAWVNLIAKHYTKLCRMQLHCRTWPM